MPPRLWATKTFSLIIRNEPSERAAFFVSTICVGQLTIWNIEDDRQLSKNILNKPVFSLNVM